MTNRCACIEYCADPTQQDGIRCSQPAVCCPDCSKATDTCLEHMDERKIGRQWVAMCQECCYAFDNPWVVQ